MKMRGAGYVDLYIHVYTSYAFINPYAFWGQLKFSRQSTCIAGILSAKSKNHRKDLKNNDEHLF